MGVCSWGFGWVGCFLDGVGLLGERSIVTALVAPSFFNTDVGMVVSWGVFSWRLFGGGVKCFDILSIFSLTG